MHTTLLLVLLIVLLLEPAATTTPALAAALSLAPMDPDYPDPDGILRCDLCEMSRDCCVCALRENGITTDLPFPEVWPEPQPEFPTAWLFPEDRPEPQPEFPPHPELLPEPTTAKPPPLYNFNLQLLEENSTTVSMSTMKVHVEGTYTLGDRLALQTKKKRHASRTGGFPCSFASCGESFNRQCDTNRHEKKHRDPSERPHKCNECEQAFWYPKDLGRHQKTHGPAVTLYCHHPECSNGNSFSRRDNLRRHQRNAHPDMAVSAQTSPSAS